MRLWAVGHGRRDQLSVEVRDFRSGGWRSGVIQGEWSGTWRGEIPAYPDKDARGNTDPLVIGRFMYYDYCKKGRVANTLDAGDTILFGHMRQGDVFIDTVFVIGERRPWPTAEHQIPDWTSLDHISRRVHFHQDAHQRQHRDVHLVSPSFSFRGRRHSQSATAFSWVPYRVAAGDPFRIPRSSCAYRMWIGSNVDRARGWFKRTFPRKELTAEQNSELHESLRAEAKRQGFSIGIEVRLQQSSLAKTTRRRGTLAGYHNRAGCPD